MNIWLEIFLGNIALYLFCWLCAMREIRQAHKDEQEILKNSGPEAMMRFRMMRFRAMRP